MGGLVKRGGSLSVSRGYCNWHTTWSGSRVFLRSKLEFIFASKLDSERVKYDTEVSVYEINGRSYKPDFFIFDDAELKSIVEIKSSKREADEYEALYGNSIRKTGIDYSVLWEKQLSLIAKQLDLRDDIEGWILRSIAETASLDMRGPRNPRFGTVCSKETKRKIGEKAKERFLDEAYREKCKESGRRFRESAAGAENLAKFRVTRKAQEEAKKDFYRKRRMTTCVVCGSPFEKRGSRSKTCSDLCLKALKKTRAPRAVSSDLAFERYQSKLKKTCMEVMARRGLSYFELIKEIDTIVREDKDRGLIPKMLGLTAKSLEKYRVQEALYVENRIKSE
jgi:hypothetical protein